MKALVTGATGYLGRRVVRDLLREGCQVRCLLRPSSQVDVLRDFIPAGDWPQVEIIRGSLMSEHDCLAALDGCQTLYHLAAALQGCTSNLFLNTVVTTRVLFEAAATSDIQRCVLVSSMAVYTTHQLARQSVVDEQTPLEPHPHRRDPYTYSKCRQEQVARDIHEAAQLPLVIVRPGVIYGYERDALSTRVGLSVGPVLLKVGGRQRLPYVFVDHCSRGVVSAGLTPGLDGQAFNLIDDELPTGSRIIRSYRSMGKWSQKTIPLPLCTIRPISAFAEWYHRWSRGQIPDVITSYKSTALWRPMQYSNARAKQALEWQPSTRLDDALLTTV